MSRHRQWLSQKKVMTMEWRPQIPKLESVKVCMWGEARLCTNSDVIKIIWFRCTCSGRLLELFELVLLSGVVITIPGAILLSSLLLRLLSQECAAKLIWCVLFIILCPEGEGGRSPDPPDSLSTNHSVAPSLNPWDHHNFSWGYDASWGLLSFLEIPNWPTKGCVQWALSCFVITIIWIIWGLYFSLHSPRCPMHAGHTPHTPYMRNCRKVSKFSSRTLSQHTFIITCPLMRENP